MIAGPFCWILLNTVAPCCICCQLLHPVVFCCRLILIEVVMPSNQSRPSLAEARARLAALGEKKPPTTAAQLRELWPEIQRALARRHSLKAICECLKAGGVVLNARTLAAYISRMRRDATLSRAMEIRKQRIAPRPGRAAGAEVSEKGTDLPKAHDPLANIRESEAKRQVFDYRPELADPEKLI